MTRPVISHVHGRGPLCVVQPGGPGWHWEYARIPAAERELTMVYLEPDETSPDDPASHAEHLHAVVGRLGGGPVFVLGHGHGGFVAQLYALRHPVAGLILHSTGPVADARTTAGTRDSLRRYAIENSHAGALAAWDRPSGPDPVAATHRIREIFPAYFADYWRREAEFAPVRDALRCRPTAAPEAFDVRSALPSISAPTLVLAGAGDIFFPPAQADVLSTGIPHARRATLRDSGHLAHLEEPERFAHLLVEFTRRVAGPLRTPRR